VNNYLLHLNGGPKDDEYVCHWDCQLYAMVNKMSSLTVSDVLSEKVTPEFVEAVEGVYTVRLDANGDPVPHNLDGYVEADWRLR